MGIRKLEYFVRENFCKWRTRVIRNSKLVIDGCSLCFSLYSADHSDTWFLGGDYYEFYSTVRSFFEGLKRNGIEMYIVIDGLDLQQDKYATIKERIQQRNKIIAHLEIEKRECVGLLFAMYVFVDVIKDMKLKFFVADGEADTDIVSLANHLCCPVLSDDSDFYVFNLEAGYIRLTSESRQCLNKGQSVRIFIYRDFDEQFGLMDDGFRVFLPVFQGNDFYRRPLITDFLGVPQIANVLEYIRRYRSIEDLIVDLKIKCYNLIFIDERIESIQSYYSVHPTSFDELKAPTKLLQLKPHVPQWVIRAFKQGNFSLSLMSFIALEPKRWRYRSIMEDMRQEDAWEFTRPIKEEIVAILAPPGSEILEVVRPWSWSDQSEGPAYEIKDRKLEIDRQLMHGAIDYTIVWKRPYYRRRALLVIANSCEIKSHLLNHQVPENLHLAVIATHYWVKRKREYLEYLPALICCILHCQELLGTRRFPLRIHTGSISTEDIRSLAHVFAHWQCSLHHIIILNQVLNYPYEYTSPARLFSGTVLYHYLFNQQEIEICTQRNTLFRLLSDVIMYGIL